MQELLTEIRVICREAISVRGQTRDIVMIPFDGEAEGPLFRGRVIGPGVDTQTVAKDGKAVLSARYMLEGTDADGERCRIFIENQGSWEDGFRPRLVTDSPLLKAWETARLSASVTPAEQGVTVRIYREGE